DEDTFNLYEFDLDHDGTTPRPLTHVSGGAVWPDVSPTGDLLTFAGYTVDGFDVFTMPYPRTDGDSSGGRPVGASASDRPNAVAQTPTVRTGSYSPWRTLAPTSWSPIVETSEQVRIGLATGGVDVLERHSYYASASWLVAAPVDAITPPTSVPDWDLGYIYDRWRPTFFAAASSHTLFGAGPADASGRPTPATLREREFEGGVLLPFRRVRSSRRVLFSILRTEDRYT